MILLEIKQILHRLYLLPHHIVDIKLLEWLKLQKRNITCEAKNVNTQNLHTIWLV